MEPHPLCSHSLRPHNSSSDHCMSNAETHVWEPTSPHPECPIPIIVPHHCTHPGTHSVLTFSAYLPSQPWPHIPNHCPVPSHLQVEPTASRVIPKVEGWMPGRRTTLEGYLQTPPTQPKPKHGGLGGHSELHTLVGFPLCLPVPVLLCMCPTARMMGRS